MLGSHSGVTRPVLLKNGVAEWNEQISVPCTMFKGIFASRCHLSKCGVDPSSLNTGFQPKVVDIRIKAVRYLFNAKYLRSHSWQRSAVGSSFVRLATGQLDLAPHSQSVTVPVAVSAPITNDPDAVLWVCSFVFC